jgi:hypothetical protein
MEILFLSVDKKHRRNGIGSALLARAKMRVISEHRSGLTTSCDIGDIEFHVERDMRVLPASNKMGTATMWWPSPEMQAAAEPVGPWPGWSVADEVLSLMYEWQNRMSVKMDCCTNCSAFMDIVRIAMGEVTSIRAEAKIAFGREQRGDGGHVGDVTVHCIVALDGKVYDPSFDVGIKRLSGYFDSVEEADVNCPAEVACITSMQLCAFREAVRHVNSDVVSASTKKEQVCFVLRNLASRGYETSGKKEIMDGSRA